MPILILIAIVAFIYWRLHVTNGDFTPSERYLEPWEYEPFGNGEQIVYHIQPLKGVPLPAYVPRRDGAIRNS